jgi:hypothetical protein
MITLSAEQIKQLEAIISEMPTKFGILILNILNEKKDTKEDESMTN